MSVSRDEIAGQLRAAISDGTYKPGDRLPSYRALADMYGAVPNTAGAAVQLLATEGLVTVKPQSAATVRSPDDAPRPAEARLADVKDELVSLQSDLRDTRQRIADLELRVSAALAKLEP